MANEKSVIELDIEWRDCLTQATAFVQAERYRQKQKWGVRTYDDGTWLKVMAEEFGELAQEMLNEQFSHNANLENKRTEAIQLAAVCLAYIQQLDSGKA